MDEEEAAPVEINQSFEMPKTGSFACLSKQTITNVLECMLSCIIFVAIVYIFLIFLDLVSVSKVDTVLKTIGYISLVVLISAPCGLYGSLKNSYTALFAYFVIGSYHLFSLVLYIWFNVRYHSIFSKQEHTNYNSSNNSTGSNEFTELTLHQITTAAYTMVVFLSLIMVTFKIISTANQIEPAKVIVVDNNPLD